MVSVGQGRHDGDRTEMGEAEEGEGGAKDGCTDGGSGQEMGME